MTLLNVIDTIKMFALKHPNINSAYEGNIYDIMNANPQQKYASVVLTQQSHTQDDMYDHYGFNIFYIDRLVDDLEENRLQIQSTGKSMLSNIIKAFCEEFDAECDNISYQTFTERFVDECAGVYATITIDIVKDTYCTEKYWNESWVTPMIVVRNQDKSVEFTANGTYTIDYDATQYSGLGKVEVEVNVPDINGSYNDGYTDGKRDGIVDGYNEGIEDGYIRGEEAGIKGQKAKLESITITENGTYTKEDGYNSVEVELPIQPNKTLEIRTNGTYVIEPDGDNIAMEQLTLEVESKPKITIPNGVSFTGSTFTEFPVENYDWSKLYSTAYMFANCPNLNCEPIINALKDGTIPTLDTAYMFNGDRIKVLDGIDFTKYNRCITMFTNLLDLEEVRNCKFPKISGGVLFSSQNSYYRLVDCDITTNTSLEFTRSSYGWYFARFQHLGNLEHISQIIKGGVVVMECDKPSIFRKLSTPIFHIWYDASKYAGWDTFRDSHPYGFYYNVISDEKNIDIRIKKRDDDYYKALKFEQVIPYNEEKGCYYVDYPYYMYFDVYVDGKKISELRNQYNIDVYLPSSNVGVYEGLDIKKLIQYTFNNQHFTINDNGLFTLTGNSTGNYQSIHTPTQTIKITVVTGGDDGYKQLYIKKNNERIQYILYKNEEREIVFDTSDCDYIDINFYLDARYLNNTYIKKIEIL